MEAVGKEVELTDLKRALVALASLHQAGFSQNLLNCSGKCKWCDLQGAQDNSEMGDKIKKRLFSYDISTLLQSFGEMLSDEKLDEDLLKQYISDASAQNLQALILKSVVAKT
jgi:hypothetical protein